MMGALRLWARRPIQIATLTVAVVALGVGSFFTVRTLTGGSGPAGAEPAPGYDVEPPGPDVTPIPGTTPDTSQPWWYIPYLNAERDKPVFDGTIAGVRITREADPGFPCASAPATSERLEAAEGSDLTLESLRPISGLGQPFGVIVALCDGKPISAEATFPVPTDPSVKRFGGSITVYRHRGLPVSSLAIPAHRWHESEIAGRTAAVADPILPDLGLGESAILVYSDGVLTQVHADGVPLHDVVVFTEGLFR